MITLPTIRDEPLPRWWLWALFAGVALLHYLLARIAPYPFIFMDELEYWRYAHQIQAGHFVFTFAGVAKHYPAYMFPLFLAIVTAPFHAIATQYAVARLADVLAITTVIFPTYALGEDLGLAPRAAFTASALTALVSGTGFGTDIMAETLFYPLLVLSVLLLLRWHRSPTARSAAAAGLLVGITALTKPQGMLLVPVVAALWLGGWSQRPRERSFSLLVLAGSTLAVFLTRIAIAAQSGYHDPWTLKAFLGYYALQAPSGTIPPLHLLLPVLGQYTAILLFVGIGAPVASLILARQRRLPPAFWAVTALVTLILLVVFARNTVLFDVLHYRNAIDEPYVRLEERYLFPALPFWFLALASTRPPRLRREGARIALVTLLVLAVAVAIRSWVLPLAEYLVTFDSPAITGLWSILSHAGDGGPTLVALALGAWSALALAGLVTKHRLLLAVPMTLLLAGWYVGVAHSSIAPQNQAGIPVSAWVARTVPGGALLVFDQSTVPSYIFTRVEFMTMHPWRMMPASAITPAVHCRAWVMTTAAERASGGQVQGGYALNPPTCSHRG